MRAVGRKKIKIEPIADERSRTVTFNKRKASPGGGGDLTRKTPPLPPASRPAQPPNRPH